MGQTFEDCDNMTEIPELRMTVTKEVNMFNLRGNLVKGIAPLLIALVSGNLFDRLSKRPFMIIPLCACILGTISEFINYCFFYQFPVEVMYLPDGIFYFSGGFPFFYLGMHGFISVVTTAQDRVGRLARIVAMENLAPILAIPLSAPTYQAIGYYGVHAIKLVLLTASLFSPLFPQGTIAIGRAD